VVYGKEYLTRNRTIKSSLHVDKKGLHRQNPSGEMIQRYRIEDRLLIGYTSAPRESKVCTGYVDLFIPIFRE
jgi:hypothetical protein